MQKAPSDQELLVQAKTIVNDLKKYQTHQGWVKYGDKPCIMQKMEAGEGMATRSTAIVNYPIQEIVAFLRSDGTLKKLNPSCIEDKYLHEHGDVKVTYLRYTAPWPVSHRDFCSVSYTYQESPTKYYLGSKHCNYPCPEVPKVVRGQVVIGGYILEAIDEKTTKVIYIASVDIKGSIPGLVKNELSKKQGEVSSKIEPAMKAQGK